MAHGSIGNMTNTLIETGARHMQQCRTNFDVLASMAGGEESLLNNDDSWCMAKDELVVSCGKHITENATITGTKYAYPSVITALGALLPREKEFIAAHYHFMGASNDEKILMKTNTYPEVAKHTKKSLQLRHFMPVGYSVGRACAHAHKGDTVASVQVGGLRTVINGAFEVQTGDQIQMYIPEAESCMFNEGGGRIKCDDIEDVRTAVEANPADTMDKTAKQRRNFYSRGLGVKQGSSDRVKSGIFSIKPYMESQNDGSHQYYGDRMRVFARALSSARPYEPVDIMIARQAL
ncbi:hypothetical protein T484DRAFT_1756187 [Baffinella frigidus]|nr:hypothetical protein T484DRAFT_1756187 [Cryptophyta sp. CCMP2293]